MRRCPPLLLAPPGASCSHSVGHPALLPRQQACLMLPNPLGLLGRAASTRHLPATPPPPPRPPADTWLKGDYDTKRQAELCHKIAVAMGFSLENGRLDVSVHPFTGGAAPPHGKVPFAVERHLAAAPWRCRDRCTLARAGPRRCVPLLSPRGACVRRRRLPRPAPAPSLPWLGRAGAHPTDVRMTTRFKQDDLTEGITGAIHESGHALYEQGRNLQYDGLPVNQVGVGFLAAAWGLG